MINKISRITRRSVIELLNTYFSADFYGRISEVEFWSRIFNLDSMPSSDTRFENMSGDIQQHRINNYDWEDNWYMDKFDLLNAGDKVFLKFLVEFFHPEVRRDGWNEKRVLTAVNKNLSFDGVALYEKEYISGRPILGAKNIKSAIPESQFTSVHSVGQSMTITIREEIYNHIKAYLDHQDYFHAVEESYKVVREKLRDVTGKEKATDIFNMNAENSKYHLVIFGKEAKPETPESDFYRGVGYLNLTIQFLRNEKSHSLATTLDENLALHYISLASLAYDLISRSKK